MREIRLTSWSEYYEAIRELRSEFRVATYQEPDKPDSYGSPRMLFRGQGRADWRLESTLFRRYGGEYGYLAYYIRVLRAADDIAARYEHTWDLPQFPALVEETAGSYPSLPRELPAIDYLLYLRHRGFASPLLDWSASPSVAAYFALADCDGVNDAAVICFVDTASGVRERSAGEPYTIIVPHYPHTDTRHTAQRAAYTTTLRWSDEPRKLHFCSEEDVLALRREGQDLAVKLVIQGTEKRRGLAELNENKIDAYSLFGTEDSLIEALEMRELLLNVP